GLSTRALRARLHLNPDELMMVLEALADIGYIARIGDGAKERWALVCDPATASIGRVLDKLLLDRHQPQLEADPALQESLNEVWRRFAQGETPTVAQVLAPAAVLDDKR